MPWPGILNSLAEAKWLRNSLTLADQLPRQAHLFRSVRFAERSSFGCLFSFVSQGKGNFRLTGQLIVGGGCKDKGEGKDKVWQIQEKYTGEGVLFKNSRIQLRNFIVALRNEFPFSTAANTEKNRGRWNTTGAIEIPRERKLAKHHARII